MGTLDDVGQSDVRSRLTSVRPTTEESDLRQIARQWNHYFGWEIYDPGRLPRPLAAVAGWMDDEPEGPEAATALVAEYDDVMVGHGVATIVDDEKAVDLLPDGRFDRDALVGERNAWLWFGAVDEAWRGHGIGRRLFEGRLDWARRYGVDMILALGWERRDGRTSRPLFEDNDFVPIQTIESYYATEDSLRGSCPDCGVWPSDDDLCQCDVTVWALDCDD